MLFVEEVNVPAGTEENNPVEKEIELKPGVLTKIQVLFPFGCNAMVKVRVLYGEKIIIPANPEKWLVGNGETVNITMALEHYDEPFRIKVIACSPGTSYDHTIYIRAEVLPEELAFPERRLAKILSEIAKRLVVRPIE